MVEIIGVRFKEVGKIYYFDPDGIKVKQGDYVIVETARGIECSEVVLSNRSIDETKVVSPLRKALRMATPEDLETMQTNLKKAKEAYAVCEKKIVQHQLDMKLIDVEYTFDGSKILFYFTADGRVDFRELVKDLAGVFRMRIELRQIGVRDEAKMYGGLGMCGRPLCCASFLDDFQPVSIKMAKEQGLSLNPTKISGTCGRLMCCLKYEQDAYEDLIRTTPKVDSKVFTPDGPGTVIELNLLRGLCKVRLDDSQEPPKFYPKADCRTSKDNCCGDCCAACHEKDDLPPVIGTGEPDRSVLAAAEEPTPIAETDASIEPMEESMPESIETVVTEDPAEKESTPRPDGARPRHRGHRGHGGQKREYGSGEDRAEERKPAENASGESKPAAAKAMSGERPAQQKHRSERPKTEDGNQQPRQGQQQSQKRSDGGNRPPRPNNGGKNGEQKPQPKGEKPVQKADRPAKSANTVPVDGADKPKDGDDVVRKRNHHRGHRGRGGRGGNHGPREGGEGSTPKAPAGGNE